MREIIKKRNELSLTQKELSKIAKVPLNFVRELEKKEINLKFTEEKKLHLTRIAICLGLDPIKILQNFNLAFIDVKNAYYEEEIKGKKEIYFNSWEGFFNYYLDNIFSQLKKELIWRGQENRNWLLQSTLTRMNSEEGFDERVIEILINNFRDYLKGRKEAINIEHIEGNNSTDSCENKFLTLGQHYGLKTPLLDWTLSPFIATFFAFSNPSYNLRDYRVIYAINKVKLIDMLEKLNKVESDVSVKIWEESTHFNPRLINQQGLFIYGPLKGDLESWILKSWEELQETGNILYKFFIPNNQRSKIMAFLNVMNINPNTLFPDISGAAQSANLNFEIDSY